MVSINSTEPRNFEIGIKIVLIISDHSQKFLIDGPLRYQAAASLCQLEPTFVSYLRVDKVFTTTDGMLTPWTVYLVTDFSYIILVMCSVWLTIFKYDGQSMSLDGTGMIWMNQTHPKSIITPLLTWKLESFNLLLLNKLISIL